jgi:hypothetical protein
VIGRFSLGAIPLAVAGGLLLAHAPLEPLKRLLGLFLITVVIWRRLRPDPKPPSDNSFIAVGAASGLGSALLGSVGPLTAPFFPARGFIRAVLIGAEAVCALLVHAAKISAYGASNLITGRVKTRRSRSPGSAGTDRRRSPLDLLPAGHPAVAPADVPARAGAVADAMSHNQCDIWDRRPTRVVARIRCVHY